MKNYISAFLPMVALLLAPASFASNGMITFAGFVVPKTCTINGGAKDFTVALPAVPISSLSSDGIRAGKTAFKIKLSGCSPASGGVRTIFESGPTTNSVTGRITNPTLAGNATNVEIAISGLLGTQFPVGSPAGVSVSIAADGSATLDYVAEYVATGGAATAGKVLTTVVYTLVFN